MLSDILRPYKYQVPSKPFDDFFLVFKNQLLKHNLYTINCIHLKCTTDNYKIDILEWNHHYNQDMEFFSLQQFSCVSLAIGSSCHSWATTHLPAVATDRFAFSRALYKWNHNL